MALRSKKTPEPTRRRAIVASAMRFEFGGKQTWKGGMPAGDRGWQSRAWYHFDICGELYYGVTWKANASAQALLYAAEIDPATGKAAKPAEDDTVIAIAETCLGGPVKRPQNVNTLATNLEVAGEAWVIIRPPTDEQRRADPGTGDEWVVVSTTELEMNNGRVAFIHPDTGEKTPFGDRTGDTLIRLYRKHPNRQTAPNSALRPLLPTLDEIERTSMNIAARLDSRLIGAGILTVPEEADLPQDDGDPSTPQGLVGLMAEAATRSLSDPGAASSQVPMIIPVPGEFADAFRHITFETPLSKEVLDLRAAAIGRLAAGLDLPREVLEGMGDSNHWSAWQVQESTYTTHLLPLLDLISDALTAAWFTHALRQAGVTDPERFILAFDGSSLIGQPDETAQTLELLDRGIITNDAARQKLNVPEEYAPQGEEERRAFVTRLVIGAPTLINDPEIRRVLGFGTPAAPVAEITATPAADTTAGTEQPNTPPSRTASIGEASLLVVFALERAGNRLLNTQRMKAQFAHVARHELHTKLRPDPERHGDILDDAWRHNPRLAADLRLDDYTRLLIADGIPHTDDLLRGWVSTLDRP